MASSDRTALSPAQRDTIRRAQMTQTAQSLRDAAYELDLAVNNYENNRGALEEVQGLLRFVRDDLDALDVLDLGNYGESLRERHS